MDDQTINQAQRRIAQIKRELQELGELRPGNITQQYNVCGNPTCRCKDPKNPQKHGPYFQLSYTWNGRGTSEFVKAEDVVEMERRVLDYKQMRALTNEWVGLSLYIAKQRKQALRDARQKKQQAASQKPPRKKKKARK